MAKQPEIAQLEQLARDLRVTSRKSSFPDVRAQAEIVLRDVDRLIASFGEYERLVGR